MNIVPSGGFIVALSVGFVVGWYSKQWLQPNDMASTSLAPTSIVSIGIDNADIESGVRPLSRINSAGSIIERSLQNPKQQQESVGQRFRQFLELKDFDGAMELYDEVSVTSESVTITFRKIVLKYLKKYLENNHSNELMTLIDMYLARHYDDTNALLILAQYQWQQGYPGEAARVIQLALTYSYQNVERENITRVFASLVNKTEKAYSEQEKWVELLSFYELLESISLIQPAHQFRQAQVYQVTGDSESARNILLSLIDDNIWGEKAKQILATMDPVVKNEIADAVGLPLERRGNHYLIDAQLNDQSTVVLMIDTGASVTSLSKRAFSQLPDRSQFNQIGSRLFNTANGVTKGQIVQADEFTLGEHTLNGINLAVLDFQQSDGIDGLLGMNVLQHFRFEIDQDSQQLILRPR